MIDINYFVSLEKVSQLEAEMFKDIIVGLLSERKVKFELLYRRNGEDHKIIGVCE